MARNRKRAKERRAARRPASGNGARRTVESDPARQMIEPDPDVTPSPLEHATPDVELADAQLALGRVEPTEETGEEFEDELEPEEALAPPGGGGRRGAPPGTDGPGGGGGAGAAAAPGPVAAPARAGLLTRLIAFLQGSWRELQRVQWPDRRQVAQATGVVLGFVIVAGVFLGLCDLAFSHLMNYILK